jgi:hypothetical protein
VERARQDPSAVSAELVAAATVVVAAIGDAADFDQMLLGFETASTPQEQLRHLYALAEFPAVDLVERTCRLALGNEVKSQNAPFLLNRCIANRWHGRRAWDIVREHWAEANERFPDNTIIRMVDAVKLLDTPTDGDTARSFFAEHPIPHAAQTLEQVLERQRVNIALRQRGRTATGGLAARPVTGLKSSGPDADHQSMIVPAPGSPDLGTAVRREASDRATPGRLPPVEVVRHRPVSTMSVIGLLACVGAAAGLYGPWLEIDGFLGVQQISASETREGELMLACAAIAGVCFLLVIAVRRSFLMIPPLLATALLLGLSITALHDPASFAVRADVLTVDATALWGMYTTVGASALALVSAFAVGWDHREL